MTVVIDAAALLAVLLDERGADVVVPVLRRSLMSSLNVSEACSRGAERGASIAAVLEAVRQFEVVVVPFDLEQARVAAELRPPTRHAGSSLGDRACLAVARIRQVPIYTGDRRMGSLSGLLGIDIHLVR